MPRSTTLLFPRELATIRAEDGLLDHGSEETMENNDRIRSEERVRALAEVVDLPLKPDQIAPLARAFDATMTMVADLQHLADAEGITATEPYDAAWPDGGRR